MANFCVECGESVQQDWNACPNCGTALLKEIGVSYTPATVQYPSQKIEPTPIVRKAKSSVQKIAEKSWRISLIGGVISLLALLTPAASSGSYGMGFITWNMWLFGFNTFYEYGYGTTNFWTDMPIPFSLSLIITFLIILSAILVLYKSFNLRRLDINTSPIFLWCGLLTIVAPIIFMVLFELYMLMGTTMSFWSIMTPGFAIIGQFVGGALIIIGYILGKRANESIIS